MPSPPRLLATIKGSGAGGLYASSAGETGKPQNRSWNITESAHVELPAASRGWCEIHTSSRISQKCLLDRCHLLLWEHADRPLQTFLRDRPNLIDHGHYLATLASYRHQQGRARWRRGRGLRSYMPIIRGSRIMAQLVQATPPNQRSNSAIAA